MCVRINSSLPRRGKNQRNINRIVEAFEGKPWESMIQATALMEGTTCNRARRYFANSAGHGAYYGVVTDA